MSASFEGTVLAVTCAWRVPEDVLVETPYVVAIVRPEKGDEVMAIGGGDAVAVGDRVLMEETAVARGDEHADVWRISPQNPSEEAKR